MKTYKVTLKPDAYEDLKRIYIYIAKESQMPEVAMAYIEKLENACQHFIHAPIRGQKRDDLRENLRIAPLDKSAVVAFEVDEEQQVVTIFNIFYGGEDYEVLIKPL